MTKKKEEASVIDIKTRLPKEVKGGDVVGVGPQMSKVVANPEDFPSVRLTLHFLKILSEEKHKVIDVLVAINLLADVVFKDFEKDHGLDQALQAATAARTMAKMFEPIFRNREDDPRTT